MNFKARERALDEARDAFARAASLLTLDNRIQVKEFLASAILESTYGLMRLAEADEDERGHDAALEHLREMRERTA